MFYFFILKKTIEIKKKNKSRRCFELQLLAKASLRSSRKKSTTKQDEESSEKTLTNHSLSNNILKTKEEEINKKLTYDCFKSNINVLITVLTIIFVYYLSIIPLCLTINDIIHYNPYIHYAFFLNNILNPFINIFFNSKFRSCGLIVCKLAFYHVKVFFS